MTDIGGYPQVQARVSLDMLQRFQDAAAAQQSRGAGPRLPAAAQVDAAQARVADYLEQRAPSASRQQLQGDLQVINKTIDAVQARIANHTATATDIGSLRTAVASLHTLLDQVEHRGTSAAAGAFIDLSRELNLGVVQTALGALANERGEAGRMQLRMESSGAVGPGTQVGGWLQTGIEFVKDDTGRVNLSIDYESAVKAGVKLKLVNVEGFVAQNGKLSLRFDSPRDAAAFTLHMLQDINNGAGGTLFKIATGGTPAYTKPTVILDVGGAVGVKMSADAPKFTCDGEVRAQTAVQKYQPPGQAAVHGSSTRYSGVAEVAVGELKVKLEAYQVQVEGDPVDENNGIQRGASVEVDVTALTNMKPISKMKESLGKLAEKMKVPAGDVDRFIQGVTEYVAKARTGHQGQTDAARESYKLVVSTQQALDVVDGSHVWNTQYVRVALKAEYGVVTEVQVPGAAEAKVSFGASKSELVYETIGRNTETYLKGICHNPAEWQQFKQQHSGFTLNVPTSDGLKAKSLKQLEARWQEQPDPRLDKDAGAIVAGVNRAGLGGVSLPDAQAIVQLFDKYSKPGDRQKLVDYIESKGVSLEQMLGQIRVPSLHNRLIGQTDDTFQFRSLSARGALATKHLDDATLPRHPITQHGPR